MKLATRISSIRRHAWKQCRSCSADSDSVPRLVRQVRAGRVDALALGLQDRCQRVLSEPVDLQVGVQLAQFVGDGDVALRVTEPDGRGDVERALATVAGGRPSACRRRAGELAQQQVDLDRVPGVRQVAAALQSDQPAAGLLGQCRPTGQRRDAVVVAVDDHHRALDSGRQGGDLARIEPSVERGGEQRLASVSRPQPTQSSRCLPECGSGRHWAKKNARKPR